MTYAAALLGILDLIICAILYKVIIYNSAGSRLVIDKHTNRIYYVQESIPHAGRRATIVGQSDEEKSEEEVYE